VLGGVGLAATLLAFVYHPPSRAAAEADTTF
jgi:hypothetical protein